MAKKNPPLYTEIEEVVPPRGGVLNRAGEFVLSWWNWLWNLRRVINDNFETAGVEDFSSAFVGRLTALEEEIRELRLREMVRELEAAFVDVAPAVELGQPADVVPAAAEQAPEQIVSVSDVEEIRQRVAVLEGSIGTPGCASSVAEALEIIREQAVADVLSVDPAVELGQLYKPRLMVQWIDPGQMYLPVTQPAAGPNVYETVVNGSAWRCFEFAPGTLAADNDNVLFITTPPDRWDGGPIIVRFIWTHPATVTNFLVAWRVQGGQYFDASSGAAALSAENANAVQDVGAITDAVYISIGTSLTAANVSPTNQSFNWSPLLFRVGRRNQSEGAVGLAVNARLLGVALIWNLRPVGAS